MSAKSNQFRLDVARFMHETSRLGPTVIGAYINIMLDYFEQGEAPPDEDAVLARIVGCDPENWGLIRFKLQHLFTIKDGRWYHDHVEAEIEAGRKRMSKSAKAAAKAAEVHMQESIADVIVRAMGDGNVPQTTMAGADPKGSRTGGSPERDRAVAELAALEPQDDDLDEDDLGDPEPPVPQPVGITFEGPLDPDFKPDAKEMVEIFNDGYTSPQVAEELDRFKRYNINMGTTSNNWPELWRRWWNRKKPPLHPAEKKPKPRVEVTKRRAPAPPEA